MDGFTPTPKEQPTARHQTPSQTEQPQFPAHATRLSRAILLTFLPLNPPGYLWNKYLHCYIYTIYF